ncbi:cation:proton antiporter subunit C [Halorubrum distributum]|uniref:NADH-ubiquinone oxidoreductase chain 4L n=3 Tax=Halorubrum distributum TaxID=29283 RepID=M0NZP9_9EURY|nr:MULTISPECIES: cation:proton antiporter subunit C [Halorubrum distributum group]ELZ27912.1 NADH-ubiquinone oxidoreductase chain 4L [Halorubrum terrestre JCM 10247]EMA62754.1 NADH-ubiquinone oxidoreductase chain 4L [Halorubrum litoreum JCM 13561]MYL15077.1 Na+/H+ antiporter subunit C [Halorubrum terrestre]MYL68226.1 Na+/H+ antiporter subunit C [Halorubrum terrestre]
MSALTGAADLAGIAGSVPASAAGAVEILATRHAYVAFALLLCIGLYMMIANKNLVKKIIGLNLFQTAIFLLFIASAYVEGGSIPIVPTGGPEGGLYVSPLPHVLVLTAIVVGVSLTAVALALCIRIYDEYGTLRTDTLRELLRDEGSIPSRRSAGASGTDGATAADAAPETDGATAAPGAGGETDD